MALDATPTFVVIITSHIFYCVTHRVRANQRLSCMYFQHHDCHSWRHRSLFIQRRVHHLIKIYFCFIEKWRRNIIYLNVNYSFVWCHLSYTSIMCMPPVRVVNRNEQNNGDYTHTNTHIPPSKTIHNVNNYICQVLCVSLCFRIKMKRGKSGKTSPTLKTRIQWVHLRISVQFGALKSKGSQNWLRFFYEKWRPSLSLLINSITHSLTHLVIHPIHYHGPLVCVELPSKCTNLGRFRNPLVLHKMLIQKMREKIARINVIKSSHIILIAVRTITLSLSNKWRKEAVETEKHIKTGLRHRQLQPFLFRSKDLSTQLQSSNQSLNCNN